MYVPINTHQGFEIMGTALAFTLTYMADAYLTSVGLANGYTEGNPLNAWLFKKIGQSLTIFIEAAAVLIGGAALTNYGAHVTELFFGGLAIGEGIVAFQNYIKLMLAKIKIS